jgi:hypothetical protein
VIVGHGPKGTRPAGRLPVFTVNNEQEADLLLTLACSTNLKGEYVAKELYEEQTMENLQAFSARLEHIYDTYIKKQEKTS